MYVRMYVQGSVTEVAARVDTTMDIFARDRDGRRGSKERKHIHNPTHSISNTTIHTQPDSHSHTRSHPPNLDVRGVYERMALGQVTYIHTHIHTHIHIHTLTRLLTLHSHTHVHSLTQIHTQILIHALSLYRMPFLLKMMLTVRTTHLRHSLKYHKRM